MSYPEITKAIQTSLANDLGMSFSIGLAPTKTLAKVASRINKPGGFSVIPAKKIHLFLENVPIGSVWGIGPNTSAYLQKQGIKTALQFAQKPEWWVKEHVSRPYLETWHELRGDIIHHVNDTRKDMYKSIMRTRTFEPTTERNYLLSELAKNIELACSRLRRYDLEAGEMSIYLKTQAFSYHRISIKFSTRLSAPQEPLNLLKAHFAKLYKPGIMYRATGVTFYDIAPASHHQRTLFDDTLNRDQQALFSLVDSINQKYHRSVIHLAQSQQARLHSRVKGIQIQPNDVPAHIPFWGYTKEIN